MEIKIVEGFSDDVSTLVIPMFQRADLSEWLASVSELLEVSAEVLQNDFKAKHKELLSTYWNGQRVVLLGLGEKQDDTNVIEAFRSLSHHLKTLHGTGVGVDFINFQFEEVIDAPFFVEMATNGFSLGQYDIDLLKSKKTEKSGLNVVEFLVEEEDVTESEIAAEIGLAVAETQREIMTLVNLPASHKNAYTLTDWAKQSGEKYGYEVQVLEETEIAALGLNALLAVNRGSEIPPRFIIATHTPKAAAAVTTVGLVGKGVTYDTGGLNIKTQGMHFMKSDMGGAAAVLGTLEMAAKLDLPLKIIGIVPVTDNCVDAKSIKPGDVIGSYSGLTIEVMDTDAEGRLILADGLSYLVRQHAPDIVIDLATLTGSSVRTLGYEAGALFTQNDELAQELYLAGQSSGECLWRLPMWDGYKKNLVSDIADVRNYGMTPLAGASEAAKFLEYFVDGHAAYAHLDIAGVAFKDSSYCKQKSGTAFGVRLLKTFFEYLTMKEEEA